MPKKRLYKVYDGDKLMMEGTADEVADVIHFTPEYIAQQGHKGGMIGERYTITVSGMEEEKHELMERIKKDAQLGLSNSVIAQRLGVATNTVQNYTHLLREKGEI